MWAFWTCGTIPGWVGGRVTKSKVTDDDQFKVQTEQFGECWMLPKFTVENDADGERLYRALKAIGKRYEREQQFFDRHMKSEAEALVRPFLTRPQTKACAVQNCTTAPTVERTFNVGVTLDFCAKHDPERTVEPKKPWMHGDARVCQLCGHDGTWHAEGNNNISACRGYSPSWD